MHNHHGHNHNYHHYYNHNNMHTHLHHSNRHHQNICQHPGMGIAFPPSLSVARFWQRKTPNLFGTLLTKWTWQGFKPNNSLTSFSFGQISNWVVAYIGTAYDCCNIDKVTCRVDPCTGLTTEEVEGENWRTQLFIGPYRAVDMLYIAVKSDFFLYLKIAPPVKLFLVNCCSATR